ncbi:YlzJ-like family protein [Selenihalanaerobacter shriftii]|uniref:YlzJ-like protein n=1 Tax=Selenihalanaerobacter shriftii TaxID=142842 RepID=A0A1T4JN59_9FIRM|nr:YlzJ-like family protein [Selenihalanaerobacter shriftii]SJZ31594.1 YlzJ-like protein [Selenihalanaerobacter shriftii]
MVYYSIIPGDMIFTEEEENEVELLEVEVNGVTMVIDQTEIDKGKVVKVISSDPQDYMQLDYQPGNKIEFTPQFYNE